MPLYIVREDIVKMQVDAIVSASNESLYPDGGVNARIHRKAGALLTQVCQRIGGCRVGRAVITKGYDLLARYVIHTVGPVWQGGGHGEEALLRRCYREVLILAARYRVTSVAFPLISAGQHAYPKEAALRIAVEEIREFLERHEEMTVSLVVFDREAFRLGSELFGRVESFVDENYVDSRLAAANRRRGRNDTDHWIGRTTLFTSSACTEADEDAALPEAYSPPGMTAPMPEEKPKAMSARPVAAAAPCRTEADVPDKLAWQLRHLDVGFSETLLRLIDERQMKDADCYKRANIDRKHFSKIRSNPAYRPKKETAVALAVALRLSLEETRTLIGAAGYALSRSNKFDVIIEYFITRGNYDIFEINQVLWAYDLPQLGS